MKTPEEIKKGLECCLGDTHAYHCDECPYADDESEVDDGCGDNGIQLLEDALALIQQLESQVPKWISVKEQMPEGECLAGCFAHGSYGYGEYIIGYVSPYSESEGSGYYAENSFELLDDVTHWMPLPEPPKED